jgi:uncharacterized OsmC-like protein
VRSGHPTGRCRIETEVLEDRHGGSADHPGDRRAQYRGARAEARARPPHPRHQGPDTAPTPGALGRGALASCLTIGIATWAARLGVPIDALEVEVQADFDARGELGVGRVLPGYTEVRYVVKIDSPAPRQELDDLLALAERHSPYLDVFGRAMALRRVLHVNGVEV